MAGGQRADVAADRDPESDPELARYLNRSYWESRQEEPRSPPAVSSSGPGVSAGAGHQTLTVTADSGGGAEPKTVTEVGPLRVDAYRRVMCGVF